MVAENPRIGTQNTGTRKHKKSDHAMEMYSRSVSNNSSGARSSVGSGSKSATAQNRKGMKKKTSFFDTLANTQSRPQNGGGGTSEGGAEVRQDSTVLYDNPMSFIALAGRGTKLGGKGRRLRKQRTEEAAEHNAYQAAHAEHVGQMPGKGSSRWGFLSASVRSMRGSSNDKQIAELAKQLTKSDKEAVITIIRSMLEREETKVEVPVTAKRRSGRRMVSHASSHVEEHGFDLDAVSTGMPEESGGTVESKRTDSSTGIEATATGKSTTKRRLGGMLSGGSRRWATRESVPLAAAGIGSVGVVVEGDGDSAAPGAAVINGNSLWNLTEAGGGRESCNLSQFSDGTRNSVPRRGGESDRGSASDARSGPTSPAEGKDGQQETRRPTECAEL